MFSRRSFLLASVILPTFGLLAGCSGGGDDDDASGGNVSLRPSDTAPSQLRLFHADTVNAGRLLALQVSNDAFVSDIRTVVSGVAYGTDGISGDLLGSYGLARVVAEDNGETLYTASPDSTVRGITNVLVFGQLSIGPPQNLSVESGDSLVQFRNITSGDAGESVDLFVQGERIATIARRNVAYESYGAGTGSVRYNTAGTGTTLAERSLTIPQTNRLYSILLYGGRNGQPFAISEVLTEL